MNLSWWKGKNQGSSRTDDFSGSLVTLLDPASMASEAYRALRTNLLYAFVDNPPQVIVVSSPGAREGKSTTCANLAVTLAQADKSVLVIDGDLRMPVMHKIFRVRNTFGLVNVVVGERILHDTWQELIPGLKVLTIGPAPPNPTELLSSERFAQLLHQLRKDFDYVFVDAPPLAGPMADSAILAAHGDGVLLVVDRQNTQKASVRRSIRELRAVGSNVLGTVMNNAEGTAGNGFRDGYLHP
jgi:capsular exopolysaccharide synthesis family protein